jgi:hypothetical protein
MAQGQENSIEFPTESEAGEMPKAVKEYARSL